MLLRRRLSPLNIGLGSQGCVVALQGPAAIRARCRLVTPAHSFSTAACTMAPRPVPLPRHICDALGLGADEAAFREGSATIVLPSREAAFLNPVQEFNRDLSVLAIRTWGSVINEEKKARFDRGQAKRAEKKTRKRAADDEKAQAETRDAEGVEGSDSKRPRVEGLVNGRDGAKEAQIEDGSLPSEDCAVDPAEASTMQGQKTTSNGHQGPVFRDYRFTILEALSATGLRSIRYAREIPQVRYVIANDLSSSAVDAMKRNVALNFPAGKAIETWTPKQHDVAPQAETASSTKASNKSSSDTDALHDESVVADIESVTLSQQKTAGAETSSGTATAAGVTGAARKSGNAAASSATPGIHPDCKVRLNEGDAITLMYTHREERKRFDVVDLDPYGSAAMFLDGAVQSVTDGGLLCVTCTDSAVLAGSGYPEKAYSAYGGSTTKVEYSHEVGLRLVLHAISTSAARYGRFIEPMLSLSIDFYVRLFVRIHTRPIEVKRLASRMGCVLTCSSCQLSSPLTFGRHIVNETRTGQEMDKFQVGVGPSVGPYCPECGSRFHTAGPMWLGKLHDANFCKRMLATLDEESEVNKFQTAARVRGMVGIAADELPGDEAPFYFTPSKISSFFHTQSPPLSTIASALLHAGYRVSRAHAVAGSLKTTAPREVIYDMYRAWVKRHPVRLDNLSDTSPSHILLTGQRKGKAIHSAVEGGDRQMTLESATAGEIHDGPTAPAKLLEPKRAWNFDDEHPQTRQVLDGSATAKGTKYQINPLPHWGPGTAAKSTPRAKTS